MSARFDVYRNPSQSKTTPFVLLVQHELLDGLATRVVVPLVRKGALGASPISRLNPSFTVQKVEVVMLTQQLGALRASELRVRAGSLASRRTEIVAALDVLLSGV